MNRFFALMLIFLVSCGTDSKVTVSETGSQRVFDTQVFYSQNTEFETGGFLWENATVYFVITDRFFNGNPGNDRSYGRVPVDKGGSNIGTFHGGDLAGLTQKLKEGYFTDLGVNALWITAPYEQIHGWVGGADQGTFAHYAYHGYYPLDFSNIDANMGTFQDFRAFVDTAHDLGIRVLVDVVMNHVGYNTLVDMERFGFGSTTLPGDWLPPNNQWHSHHSFIDYNDAQGWSTWWGPNWVRAGIGGYPRAGRDALTQAVHSLPDLKTEDPTPVELPVFLQNKETYRGQRNVQKPVSDWLIGWLTKWVSDYGIDGFRVDTAKHVGLDVWARLKDASTVALEQWRRANPNKQGAGWSDPFWMTAEVFGQGPVYSEYHREGKFDSVINFSFQNEVGRMLTSKTAMDQIFQRYGNLLNGSNPFQVLNYISSHDTGPLFYQGNDEEQKKAGTALLLNPGGAQIFYGDEVGRETGPGGGDADQGSRSSFPWEKAGNSIHQHWMKVGQFRQNNPAVGAGVHSAISMDNGYTFGRSWTNPSSGAVNNVVVVIDGKDMVEVDVSRFFPEGMEVRNAYDGTLAKVTEGKVSFSAGDQGLILIEKK